MFISNSGTKGSIDFQRIRERHPLPELLANRGVRLRQSGNRMIAKCPLHQERQGHSLVIEEERWKCYGKCQSGGDVVDLIQIWDGLSMADALDALGASRVYGAPVRRSPKVHAPVKLSQAQLELKAKAAARLYGDFGLQSWLAKHRGWTRKTIQALAAEHSLGWLDEWTFPGKDGRPSYSIRNILVFGYEHGLKLRYHTTGHPLDGGDGRRIRWLCGGPSIWRGALGPFKDCPNVIVTEGETDAITGFDRGLNSEWPSDPAKACFVVALPSASTWHDDWAKYFTDKQVLLAFDADEAGEKALTRIGNAVYPFSKAVKYVEFNER